MAKIIGYARVSTDDQNLDLQRDALLKAGCAVIYEEKASGKNATDRPELDHCRKALRAGDTLVVWRLDRLGRSLKDLVQIVSELELQNVSFQSITEKIETSSAAGKLIFHVFASLAEFERNLIVNSAAPSVTAAYVLMPAAFPCFSLSKPIIAPSKKATNSCPTIINSIFMSIVPVIL